MNKKTYYQLLKDPRWQKKRLEIFERDEFKCQMCGSKDDTLNVHHISYNNGDPWEVHDSALITLCEECHEIETEALKETVHDLIKILKESGMMSQGFKRLSKAFLFCNRRLDSKQNIDALTKMLTDERFWLTAEYEINNETKDILG